MINDCFRVHRYPCWSVSLLVKVVCFNYLLPFIVSHITVFKINIQIPSYVNFVLMQTRFFNLQENLSAHSALEDGGLYTEQNRKDLEFFFI